MSPLDIPKRPLRSSARKAQPPRRSVVPHGGVVLSHRSVPQPGQAYRAAEAIRNFPVLRGEGSLEYGFRFGEQGRRLVAVVAQVSERQIRAGPPCRLRGLPRLSRSGPGSGAGPGAARRCDHRVRGSLNCSAAWIRSPICSGDSPRASPVRTAAAKARVRPAAPRKSASGPPGSRFWRAHSARLSAVVPRRRWAWFVRPRESQLWQRTGSSAPDQLSRGIASSVNWKAKKWVGTVPRRDTPGRLAARKLPYPSELTAPSQGQHWASERL